MDHAATEMKARLFKPARSAAMYPRMEEELTREWKARRAKSRKVSPRWMQIRSRHLMRKHYPEKVAAWKASRGWQRNYCKRMNPPLVPRKVTNKRKHDTVEVEVPIMGRYHHGLRILVQSEPKKRPQKGSVEEQDVEKFGRFAKRRRLSKDQIPLPFVVNQNTTYDERGREVIKVKAGSDGLTKRQFTAELTFAAGREPKQQPKPGIVFRGQGKLPQAELQAYSDDVHVYHQRCAWVDRPVSLQIAKDLVADEKRNLGLDAEWLLSVDQLDAQKQLAYKKIIGDAGGKVVHPPAGLTHQGAAVDRGYGRAVQCEIMLQQDLCCDANEENYERWESGSLSAGDRRILMSFWLGAAVKVVNGKLSALEKYMGHAGLLMTADGSDDDLIKLEGLPKNFKYDFMSMEPDPWLASHGSEEDPTLF